LTVARYVHELEINGVAGWDARHASGCPPRAAGVPTAITKPATTAIVSQIVPERQAMRTRTDHRARTALGARASEDKRKRAPFGTRLRSVIGYPTACPADLNRSSSRINESARFDSTRDGRCPQR